MKKLIKMAFRKCGFEIKRYESNPFEEILSLEPERQARENVLLSLWIEPFLLKNGESVPNSHAHYWRSLQMARTFLDLGYRVDVIDYRNSTFIPRKKYAFFVAFRTNFERIGRLLNKECIRIVHLDTAHWIVNNCASLTRALNLQKRRGVTLQGLRIVEHNLAIESADYATISGNQFTIGTYSYIEKPLFRIPYPPCAIHPWPEEKKYDRCRKTLLWFGSGGFVHKGLDLVLETFIDLPDYHLYICGPVQTEKDFEKIYFKELYQTPNIHTVGWVDISSAQFTKIADKCVGLIYPSCSEGGGGSVINCMHAGLIPVVSYESSVDVESSYGVMLEECTINGIKHAVKLVSRLPAEKLQQMARKAWEFARTNHTKELFAAEFRKTIEHIAEYHGRCSDQDRRSPQ